MNIILLGPQGSGKGTIARSLAKDFGLIPISTGDLFRESIAKKGKLGLEAQKYMNKGVLVPLDLTIKILTSRINQPDCQKGVILDGFPRSLDQAKALEKIIKIDYCINIDLPHEECIRRVLERRICPKCHQGYNINWVKDNTCPKCGSKLVQRDDDKLEAVKIRLEVYEKTTAPLINFYSDRLLKISGLGSPEDVYKPVKAFLSKLGGKN